jgi:hypothetical protein
MLVPNRLDKRWSSMQYIRDRDTDILYQSTDDHYPEVPSLCIPAPLIPKILKDAYKPIAF